MIGLGEMQMLLQKPGFGKLTALSWENQTYYVGQNQHTIP